MAYIQIGARFVGLTSKRQKIKAVKEISNKGKVESYHLLELVRHPNRDQYSWKICASFEDESKLIECFDKLNDKVI